MIKWYDKIAFAEFVYASTKKAGAVISGEEYRSDEKINGGYVDHTGGADPEYQFSNIFMY